MTYLTPNAENVLHVLRAGETRENEAAVLTELSKKKKTGHRTKA